MPVTSFQPPRAPPDHLRLQSFQILSRLRLIPQFQPWLEYTKHNIFRRHSTPLELLWDCFSFGAPLGTLLSLLGSPAPTHLINHVEEFDFGIGVEEREEYFMSFILRVQLLEMQGRVPYGEVLRCEDFLSGTNSAFAKVLRTVYRLLVALQESYPGLFTVPRGSVEKRQELVVRLLETERAHLSLLKIVVDAAVSLSESLPTMEPCLECFMINRTRLLQYHDQLFKSIDDVASKTAPEHWVRLFALDDDLIRTKVFSAYRSLCVNYLGLVNFLETTAFEPTQDINAKVLLNNLNTIISRISEYCRITQDILNVTLPTHPTYNSLCEAVFRLHDISENMDEVGFQLRTMRSARTLKNRAYIWSAPDPEELGVILLSDRIMVDPYRGTQYSVFLFEALLLCCQEGLQMGEQQQLEQVPLYPIKPWQMGPALRRNTALDIVHAIPTSALTDVVVSDKETIEIDWVDNRGILHTLIFRSMVVSQWEQWISTLQMFVPPIYLPPRVSSVTHDDAELSEDETRDGRRLVHAKSWSIIARKGPHSESSSLMLQDSVETDTLFSPGLLPTLFRDVSHSPPPLSPLPRSRLPTPPPDLGQESGLVAPLDLTGKITREGRYPSAHGGFSDVWKGVWHDGDSDNNVAVKVLRSGMGDPEMEEKMIRRLRRELSVWKKLDHPHVLKLYGTASDFGHYSSMVCPWMDNGSISKYIERCGDIMSTSDRLKFLYEVASGLSYLHSCSIVHGDLTGSNILINDEGKACLCDFGLSSIIVEFHGTSYFTSTIGGAVRWADALLYRLPSEGEPTHVVGTWSDIYSFGSVMLEILSGRIPYHYLRTDAQVVIELHMGNKPRRPARSFMTDGQWSLIKRCWTDEVKDRPDIIEVCKEVQTLYDASLTNS